MSDRDDSDTNTTKIDDQNNGVQNIKTTIDNEKKTGLVMEVRKTFTHNVAY